MSALRVSLVQEPLVWHDPPANRARFTALLTPLAQRTDLIVLPETFTSGFSMEVERLAERAGGPTVIWMQAQAARTDAAITGSVITAEDGKYYPAARAQAWRQLLRARAIENQAYVVGVNRVGADGAGVAYAGDSAAVDFVGRPLSSPGEAAGVSTVELDGTALAAFRERFPAHLDADRFTLEP
jgi:predicted amidohydrolase